MYDIFYFNYTSYSNIETRFFINVKDFYIKRYSHENIWLSKLMIFIVEVSQRRTRKASTKYSSTHCET